MNRKIITLTLMGLIIAFHAFPQEKVQKHKVSFKDTLDGKFDMSDYVINLHGFVPWPTIISEPALGNFGVALAAVFISPKKTAKPGEQYHFPDITGIAGMWTLNNSWGIGLIRQGTFPKIGMRYTVGGGYVDANMDYYRTSEKYGEVKFSFNLKPIVAVLDVSENLFKNKIFAGLRYEYMYMMARYKFSNHTLDSLSNIYLDQSKLDKSIGTLGVYFELDYRNTIFTPDRGLQFKTTGTIGRNWTASDVDINKIESYAVFFFQPWHWLVCGLRAYGVAVNSDIPFYLYPYLDMRGIPMMKYQGQQLVEFETEERFDITRRWSLVGFVGTGRTWSTSKYLSDDLWHWSGGGGFRYLIARVFKLRMGIDLAASKNQFAYYIVFGHYWDR